MRRLLSVALALAGTIGFVPQMAAASNASCTLSEAVTQPSGELDVWISAANLNDGNRFAVVLTEPDGTVVTQSVIRSGPSQQGSLALPLVPATQTGRYTADIYKGQPATLLASCAASLP